MRLKLISFALFVAGTGCLSPSPSQADPLTMTFTGLSNNEAVGNYYNGGAGGDYGVSYSSNAKALTGGSFSNEPSAPDILYWTSGSTSTMDVANGFDTSLSFYYASTKEFTVDVYDGVDGTGNLLVSQSYSATPDPYDVWDQETLSFSGIAESVVFNGAADYVGLDDVTLANLEPAPSAVPEPSSIAMTALGAIFGVGAWYRRRRLASTA